MDEAIGKVIHFYDKISVAVVRLEKSLKVGDMIQLKGKNGEFEQVVVSMQIDHKNVETAKKGDEVAIKFDQKVREGDLVYKK